MDLIIDTDIENPGCFHIGYGFDYDVNQICRTLPYRYLQILRAKGQVKFGQYRIAWRKGKSFTVTRTLDGVTHTVTIYDVFSFFACSFVKALQLLFKDNPEHAETIEQIAAGKLRRKEFGLGDLDREIIPYWESELRLLALLGSNFRDLLYSADFPITQWYGPGALASLVLKRNNIPSHMSIPPREVNECAQRAYAGGRFELFRIGRHVGPAWGIDINSAYPHALSLLPSLASGKWEYVEIAKPFTEIARDDIVPFAMYHVELHHAKYSIPLYPHVPPSPLFYRTGTGEMMFPWNVEGWYWGPEVASLTHPDVAEHGYCYGAWIWKSTDNAKPFKFILDMYSQRAEWKRSGKPEQLALKLAMNSIYGKLAQRVGWEHKGGPPTFHQLEWAGFVTSYVRAHLWCVLYALGPGVISVETDGIYTFNDPAQLGITDSKELGEWSVERYDEIIYLQNGLYWTRQGDNWSAKYRGLDPSSLSREQAESYLQSVFYRKPQWSPISGTTTRYIGLGAALARSNGDVQRFRELWGVWFQDQTRDITPGENGKRVHTAISCVECNQHKSPYETMHYQSVGIPPVGERMSYPHHLPWKESVEYKWRKSLEYEQGKLFEI